MAVSSELEGLCWRKKEIEKRKESGARDLCSLRGIAGFSEALQTVVVPQALVHGYVCVLDPRW